MKRSVGTVIVTVMVLAAGCSSESSSTSPTAAAAPRGTSATPARTSGTSSPSNDVTAPPPTEAPTSAPETVPTVPPPTGPVTQAADPRACKGHTPVSAIDAGIRNGIQVGPEAITSTGRWLVDRSLSTGSGDELDPASAGITTHSGTFEQLVAQPTKSPTRQFIATAQSGDNVAWLDTTSMELETGDWRLLASQRGEPAHVVASSDPLIKHLGATVSLATPEYEPLAIVGNNAYFTVSYADARNQQHADLYQAPLSQHDALPTLVERNALAPATDGKDLFYLATNGPDKPVSLKQRTPSGTSVVTQAAADRNVTALCASPRFLAWGIVDHVRSTLVVRDRTTNRQRSFLLKTNSMLTLACGNHFVIYGNSTGDGDPGQYLLSDLDTPPVKLGDAPGVGDVMAAGDFFAWAQPSGNFSKTTMCKY